MAVTATLLDGQLDDVARSTYTTASKTPTSNQLQLLAVELHDATPAIPPTPTVTGCGLTWDLVTTLIFAVSNQRKITIYRAQGASPSTGSLSIVVGSTVTRAFWHWVKFAGTKVGNNGADAIVQFASNTLTPAWTGANPETFSLAITLAAFGDAGNAAFSFWGTNGTLAGNSLTAAPEAGWTELSEQFGPAVATGLCESQFRDTPDTTPSVDITKTGTGVHSAVFAGIALEIAAFVLPPPQVTGSADMAGEASMTAQPYLFMVPTADHLIGRGSQQLLEHDGASSSLLVHDGRSHVLLGS